MEKFFSGNLKLLPLSLADLKVLLHSRAELEKMLGLASSGFRTSGGDVFDEEFKTALREFIIPKVEENPESCLWYTHWLILDADRNMTVGGIGAAGIPDKDGRAMIGYYIDQRHEGKGVASEGLRLFIAWLEQDQSLKEIVADTQVHNIASQRVLEKNGFVLLGEVEEGLRWQLTC